MKASVALRSLAAAALVSLALAGAVLAADPTVGGQLSAGGNRITVQSNGNVPARVSMAAESVTLSVTTFELQPGESRDLTFTGKAVGYVNATYEALVDGQETATATLSLNLEPVPPTPPSPLGAILIGLLLLAGLAFIVRRLHPWTWRIVVNPPTDTAA